MDMWAAIATERRRLADELEQLTPEQWAMQSQCDAWDIRHAAAHVLLPFKNSTSQFMWGLLKSGFNLDKFIVKETAEIASTHTNEQIIQAIRDNADHRWTPPGPKFGAEIPLTEILVHGQDIRRPLGIEGSIPQETITGALAAISNEKTREHYRQRIEG